MSVKEKVIIFEGVDKSGKTTLMNAYNAATGFSHWCLDRGPVSSMVYDKMFKRKTPIEKWKNIAEGLKNEFEVWVVYCFADEEDIFARLEQANEKLPKEISNIADVENEFKEMLSICGFNFVMINTSVRTVGDAVERLKAVLGDKKINLGSFCGNKNTMKARMEANQNESGV